MRSYVRDPNVHDLLATNASSKDITNFQSYKSGNIVLQDKASCFPAHLLLNSTPQITVLKDCIVEGDVLDGFAAPGNKTSHLASILATRANTGSPNAICKRAVFGCERDAKRSKTLEAMLARAGAGSMVEVLAKQDFLALAPEDSKFSNVTHLLLDPSCSGSGILGRQDVPILVLPKDSKIGNASDLKASDHKATGAGVNDRRRKRKRTITPQTMTVGQTPETDARTSSSPTIDIDRLHRLSNLQTRIIEHAFAFPNAKMAAYSTCSIHTIENECVALRALSSEIATRRGWRVLRRDEQPDGLKIWPHRGDILDREERTESMKEYLYAMTKEERVKFREACIRCRPGGEDGTMGFFVVGFVKDPQTLGDSDTVLSTRNNGKDLDGDESDEWEGLSSGYGDD
jgi:25S rRNA (cytosine2278-C5)-methyltransferase